LFSAIAQGVSLTAAELSRIQAEDDRAVVMIGGQETAIEQDAPHNIAWTRLLVSSLGRYEPDFANTGITTGTDGSIYVTGITGGRGGDRGNSKALITKYDTSGNTIWTRWLGGDPDPDALGRWEITYGITTGTDGSIYVLGRTHYSGGGDAFITKYDTSGNTIWTQLLGLPLYTQASEIRTGTDGSIYVSGYTYIDSYSLHSDVFITKYDTSGNKIWTKLLEGSLSEFVQGMTTGTDGSIYISGNTESNLDGQTNNGNVDAFITKYDTSGNKIWTRLLGGSSSDFAYGITTGTDGSIYVSGYTWNAIWVGKPMYADAFITKYDTSGNKIWTKLLGKGRSDNIGLDKIKLFSNGYASEMTTGTDGSIYISGNTESNLDGQTNNGGSDIFVIKYDTSGNKIWTKLLGGSSDDLPSSEITTGTNGSIYVSGSTSGNLYGQTNNTNGGYDAFVIKLNVNNFLTLVVSANSVTEDGPTNLVYTFTRTGDIANALTVNYSIAGTADATDYTGATPGTGKTITFAANSATATLTINPTADAIVETDETVSLTLDTGTGYTIGTTTAVTGTITNDDNYGSITGVKWNDLNGNGVREDLIQGNPALV
jgi:hypothetical protein